MARIRLKKLIQKEQAIVTMLEQWLQHSGGVIAICDEKDNLLLGKEVVKNSVSHEIKSGDKVIGKVYGSGNFIAITDFIHALVRQEEERKRLGSEVLDLYREVNTMYNFAQKLAQKIDPVSIARLTLDEISSSLAADGGIVALSNEDTGNLDRVAQFGSICKADNGADDYDAFCKKLMETRQAGILNDYKRHNGTVVSVLYTPLKVKENVHGIVLLENKDKHQYEAADLKLMSTLSLQSAAAIESARLYEENIREAKRREAAISALHQAASRFVPDEFIKFLGYDAITEVALGDSIEKDVTVLFSDIRGYTSLSENMTPAQTFNFVNAFNRRMGPIVLRNNGFINQYLGDGIMAIFPRSPVDALQTAIEMQQRLQVYNTERMKKNRPEIKIGIGLHTGPLVMGITGDERRMDAATISDTVNTAARIESLTKTYGVNILLSEDSLLKVQEASGKSFPPPFSMRYLGEAKVKGKKELIKIYECFDGDLPEAINLKHQSSKYFEMALGHFYKQDFTAAKNGFKRVLRQNPQDKTAHLFLNSMGKGEVPAMLRF